MIEEGVGLVIDEEIELIKYEGDPVPENAVQRILIKNGEIISVEDLKPGEGG